MDRSPIGVHVVEGYGLSFTDGPSLSITGDEGAVGVLADAAGAMQLGRVVPHGSLPVHVCTFGGPDVLADGAGLYLLSEPATAFPVYERLIEVAAVLVHAIEGQGGVLVHGALALHGESAVILAGAGGTGKTTASNRLLPPWRSLSDDATLVVPRSDGTMWAHPWPTWSRFGRPGARGGTWRVEVGHRLSGVFFMKQADEESVCRVGAGQACCILCEVCQQLSPAAPLHFTGRALRASNLRRFENVCALATRVPAWRLHVRLTGRFWELVESALAGVCGGP